MSIARRYGLTGDGRVLDLSKPTEKQRKAEKAARKREGKDPAHLAKVAQLRCICCGAWPVEVHHPICGRYSQVKAPDRCALPVCDRHHQGKWDTRGPAIHKDRAAWVEEFGEDTDYIAVVLDMIENGNGPMAYTV